VDCGAASCVRQQQPDRAGLAQQTLSGRLSAQADAVPRIENIIAVAAKAIASARG
jgi:hypothetical protein